MQENIEEQKMWEKQETGGIWLPKKEGDVLIGEVTAIVTTGLYGNQYKIIDEDGEEHITPSHKVLVNRMSNIQVGNIVKIVYVNEELPKVKGQNPTKMYEVYKKVV